MGTFGAKHTEPRTPAQLRRIAGRLESCAKSLRQTAGDMALAGVRSVEVLGARGMDTALREVVGPFVVDAEKKAAREVARR